MKWLLFLAVLLNLAWGWPSLARGDELVRTSHLGPVTARVTLSPAHPRLGDAISLTLEVEGEKGVELQMPEFGQSLGRFTIVDFVPGEKVDETSGKTVAKQKYTLQPPMSGKQQVPPLIISFIDHRPENRPAPEGEDAYELLTEKVDFEVASVIPQGAEADLKPPLSALGPWTAWQQEGQVWWWLVLALILAAVALGAWAYRRRRRRPLTRRTPFEIASFRLARLKSQPRPTPEEMDAFFVQLSDIIRHYLGDRFHIRAPEKTTEEFFEAAANSPDLTAEHRGFLFRFLEFSDQVKFARHQPTMNHVDQALAAAEEFLRQTGQEREVSHA
ncbi:MAG: hypothetical protein HQL73_03930 [Magnetococcales bacterium]|nr:hypothetical protein [Magnetococcales bacterium]